MKSKKSPQLQAYHKALGKLSRSAVKFAHSILITADAARQLDMEGNPPDDKKALQTLEECRTVLLSAFGWAPGMIQIFTGKGE